MRRDAAIPAPGTTLPQKLPSYTDDEPHDGLRSFNIAQPQPERRAVSRVS